LEEHDFGSGRFEIGARVQRDERDPKTGPELSFTPLSLSVGSVFDVGEHHHLKLYATRAQRAPVAEELYAFGPHGATATFERGDTNLDEETSNNVELGIDYHGNRMEWSANVYYQKVDDYIVLREVDRGLDADGSGDVSSDGLPDFVDDVGAFDPNGELLLVDYVQSDAEFYGAEVMVSYVMLTVPFDLEAELFGDTVLGELDNGDNLPRVTPRRFGVALDGNAGAWFGNVAFTRVLAKDNLALLETPTSGYNMLTINLCYRFDLDPSGRRRADIYVQGRNLLDAEVRRATSFVKDLAPAQGATIVLGVRLTI
jgi:iron complex outermembrane receptor protein